MLTAEIIRVTNKHLDDEGLSTSDLYPYLDMAIATLNVECGAKYPMFSSIAGDSYTALPESWIRLLVIPFAAAQFKTQDDESNVPFMNTFHKNLNLFKTKYVIPTEYLDENALSDSVYNSDTSGVMFGGGW